MESMCRTCLRSPETLLPLFDESHLPQKIEIISSVQVSETDNLPTKICAECVININLSYNFRRVIINSDLDLKQRLCTLLLNQNKIVNSEVDNLQFVQVHVKAESDGLREEHYLVENTSGSFEDVENEGFTAVTIKTEETEQIGKDNGKAKQVTKASELEITSSRLAKTTSHGVQVAFRGILHRNHVHKCNVCDFVTTNSTKYSQHRRKHSSKSMCNICGKTLRSDNLKKHISNHTEPPVPCKECGKVCKNSESLRSHQLIHKGGEITCEFCGQVFKYRGGYKRHVWKKHTTGASRKAKCHLCEKMFHDNTDLKKHLRSHTGERPYPCEYCKKGFSSTHALKTHVRQHTNERPYTCHVCPMAFPQKVSLRTHLQSKHSIQLDHTINL